MKIQSTTSPLGQNFSCIFPEGWDLAEEIVLLSPISAFHALDGKLEEAIGHVWQQLIAADEKIATKKIATA